MDTFWLILRWSLAVPLALLWLVCLGFNGWVASRRLRRAWAGPSHLPVIGTVAAILTVRILPVHLPVGGLWLVLLGFGPDLVVLLGSAIGHALQLILGPLGENPNRTPRA